jgi:1,4-dihydroxy-2-naphthoate octaprenyltransferase
LITSTIHCADFPDIDGDRAQGRTTLPILFPKASRAAFFVAIAAWSWYLVRAWALGICCASAFIGFGLYIGWRVIRYVDQKADKRSYLLYNVRDFNGCARTSCSQRVCLQLWLLTALLLPANARWGVLAV